LGGFLALALLGKKAEAAKPEQVAMPETPAMPPMLAGQPVFKLELQPASEEAPYIQVMRIYPTEEAEPIEVMAPTEPEEFEEGSKTWAQKKADELIKSPPPPTPRRHMPPQPLNWDLKPGEATKVTVSTVVHLPTGDVVEEPKDIYVAADKAGRVLATPVPTEVFIEKERKLSEKLKAEKPEGIFAFDTKLPGSLDKYLSPRDKLLLQGFPIEWAIAAAEGYKRAGFKPVEEGD
jgi:hypothetical protein